MPVDKVRFVFSSSSSPQILVFSSLPQAQVIPQQVLLPRVLSVEQLADTSQQKKPEAKKTDSKAPLKPAGKGKANEAKKDDKTAGKKAEPAKGGEKKKAKA